jgi:hypothetical protein
MNEAFLLRGNRGMGNVEKLDCAIMFPRASSYAITSRFAVLDCTQAHVFGISWDPDRSLAWFVVHTLGCHEVGLT